MTYKDIVKDCTPKEDKVSNALSAFLSGGLIGFSSEILRLLFGLEWMMIILIGLTSILTGLGVFDKLVKLGKMGLIIPITGFANSITSAILDYKHEGLITGIGSNCFKLAGSVILYGIISASVLAIIRGVLCLL